METLRRPENSRSVKLGEFLQVVVAQILKKNGEFRSHHQRPVQVGLARKRPSSRLTYYEPGAADGILQDNLVAA